LAYNLLEYSLELVFVDDGSGDHSLEILLDFSLGSYRGQQLYHRGTLKLAILAKAKSRQIVQIPESIPINSEEILLCQSQKM
jgi:glycosyltransferase involved in cell wall biosynthesis